MKLVPHYRVDENGIMYRTYESKSTGINESVIVGAVTDIGTAIVKCLPIPSMAADAINFAIKNVVSLGSDKVRHDSEVKNTAEVYSKLQYDLWNEFERETSELEKTEAYQIFVDESNNKEFEKLESVLKECNKLSDLRKELNATLEKYQKHRDAIRQTRINESEDKK